MTEQTTEVSLTDRIDVEVRTGFPVEIWPTALNLIHAIEADEDEAIDDEDLIDVLVGLVVNDEIPPDVHISSLTSRDGWERLAKQHGTKFLIRSFQIIVRPAYRRYRGESDG